MSSKSQVTGELISQLSPLHKFYVVMALILVPTASTFATVVLSESEEIAVIQEKIEHIDESIEKISDFVEKEDIKYNNLEKRVVTLEVKEEMRDRNEVE